MIAGPDPLLATVTAGLLLAVVAAVLLLRLRVVFIVELTGGRASIRRGQPPTGFAAACEDVARRHGITSGRITGVRSGSGVGLRFSRDIPARSHQAFRNVWTPPPSGGGPSGGGMRAQG
ncbi:DUF3634 family protein [Aquisalimonas lutea]|uniref:DUF3634 family protein n=1 Tax=Aquisalimonas lutea TaxID=1327750 RepID=UPI0025B589E1|nr:DUF3634 family protein [Aquisalimonas lutea]MDN3516202.1 DUF3634 family protein [Aquisalimonas lutea]